MTSCGRSGLFGPRRQRTVDGPAPPNFGHSYVGYTIVRGVQVREARGGGRVRILWGEASPGHVLALVDTLDIAIWRGYGVSDMN